MSDQYLNVKVSVEMDATDFVYPTGEDTPPVDELNELVTNDVKKALLDYFSAHALDPVTVHRLDVDVNHSLVDPLPVEAA